MFYNINPRDFGLSLKKMLIARVLQMGSGLILLHKCAAIGMPRQFPGTRIYSHLRVNLPIVRGPLPTELQRRG